MNATLPKFRKSARKLLVCLFLSLFAILNTQKVYSQVLIGGTSFEPTPGNEDRFFIGDNDIVHYGLQGGALTIVPDLVDNVDDPNEFHSSYHYAITNNPANLDPNRYVDLAANPEWMLVVSPNNTNIRFLNYSVHGLLPGSPVEVRIEYCHIRLANDGCNTWDVMSMRGAVNPQNPGVHEGTETAQLQGGGSNCGTHTYVTNHATNGPLRHATTTGEAVFSLANMQTGNCRPIAIKSIEVYGTPNPTIISSQGTEVCAGEQINIQSTIKYNADYQWQRRDGGAWVNIPGATSQSVLGDVPTVGSYEFRLGITPTSGSTVYSNILTVDAITCCEIDGAPASRQTVFFDDFGRIDMDATPVGSQFIVWDYSDVLNPQEITVPANAPFRRTIAPAPLGATFRAAGPPIDGEYVVAGYLTGYNDFNGHAGARLEWANRVTGPVTPIDPSFDRSGTIEGAALFLNCPPNTGGQVLYSRTISNLCFGKQLFFECWIAVFTNSAGGAYNPVDISVRLTDGGDAGNVVTQSATATRQADGGGVWVQISAQINLVGDFMIMDIINNEDVAEHGNDLVLDDIKVMACAPPAIQAFFDLPTLAQTIDVCLNEPLDIETQASSLLTSYYNGDPRYLFQWSRTPQDHTSWQNMGTPQAGESVTIPIPGDHDAFAGFTDDGDVYFRVIAATPLLYSTSNNFTSPNYANYNDPCKNYSVSQPIQATVNCIQPIELISFNGKKEDNVNKLFWNTAFELNNKYFLVQRSANGKDFETIGRVDGNGTTIKTSSYNFNDENPLNGKNYYRLKQTDFDGKFSYSNTINLYHEHSDVSVFPNPNDGSFTIKIMTENNAYKLDIIDVHGKVAYVSSGSNIPEFIEVNNLAKGMYFLRLYVDDQIITRKIVVQ